MKHNTAKALPRNAVPAQAIVREIVEACEDAKGRDLTILDVSRSMGLVDNFVIVSGRSDRQVQGIAHRIVDQLARFGIKPTAIEGLEEGQWVLLDFSDVIVHIFYEPLRSHYDLESLWLNAERIEVTKARRARRPALRAA